MIDRLKAKWGIESNWQVLVIMVAFGLAGSSVVVLRKAYFDFLGFTEDTEWWKKTIAYILFIFPAYQLLLLFYGTLLGQYKFFWSKAKILFKMISKK